MDVKGIAIVAAMVYFFFTIPTPDIRTVVPNHANNAGIVSVVVNGAGFAEKASVKLTMPDQEDITATDVKVISKEKIECNFDLKGKVIGKWDLVVKNQLFKSATLPGGFEIGNLGPSIQTVNPSQSYNKGVANIVIQGSAFRKGAAVMLTNQQMDIGAANVRVLSDSQITCDLNLNQADPGAYHLKVVNDDGKVGVLTNGFTILGSPKPEIKVVKPVIESIDPNKGFNNGMILTNIRGNNFEAGSTIKLTRNGQIEVPGLNTKVEDATKMSCFFDINGKPEGEYDIEVTNPNGQKAVLSHGFTVEAFTPNSLELNKALKPIYFDLNQALLRSNQKPVLASDLSILKANPKLFILLGGHADERGTIEYNLELSAKRAGTIRKYLLENGIDPKRITIYAYGKEFPAVKGHKELFWQLNRRVDVMVWEAPPTKEQGIQGLKGN